MRLLVPFAFALSLVVGCSTTSSDAPAPAASDADLTQQTISKMSSAELEAVRVRFGEAKKSDVFAFAAAVKWGTDAKLGTALTAEQLDFLATRVLTQDKRAATELPSHVDLHVDAKAKLANALDAADPALDAALEGARNAGHTVARYGPKVAAPNAKPTAGALVVVDMEHQEALVLYRRRGAEPLHADCEVTTMHAYEFEEALSKDEYPHVSANEVPLLGDVLLDIGANGTYSNADAAADERNYTVVVRRDGAKVEIEASGEFFDAKLVLEGATGTVYGDRDGNKRWNKAATVACKTNATTK